MPTPTETADPVERTRSGPPSDEGNRGVTRRLVAVRMAGGAGLGVRRGIPIVGGAGLRVGATAAAWHALTAG